MSSLPAPWWQRPPVALLVSVVAAVAIVATAPHIPADSGMRMIDETGVALGVAAAFALLLAWLNPVLMLAAVTALLATYWGMHFTGGPAIICGPLAVLRFGLMRSRRELYVGATATVAVMLLVVPVTGRRAEGGELIAFVALTAAAGFAADAVTQRSRRRAAEAESQRHQQEQGVAEQQLALARELHDGIAHSLTAIAVQASVVERAALVNAELAAEAASEIAATTRTALAELNAILRSLRRPGAAEYTPGRGLGDLDELLAQSERSGHTVRVSRDEDLAAHSEERSRTAYRVVQEALTNATRYAPGSTVEVELRAVPQLSVRVTDDGPRGDAVAAAGSGYGLVGMRERVESTGGRLRHGRRPGRGYEVEATWPT